MLANNTKYAITGLGHIMKNSVKGEITKVGEIAERHDIPQAFLSKILQQLTRAGFLSSKKGPNGGFYLTEEQMQTSIMDIVIELEGEDFFSNCLLRFEACNNENPCPVHFLLIKEKDAITNKFRKIKIVDLIDSFPKKLTQP